MRAIGTIWYPRFRFPAGAPRLPAEVHEMDARQSVRSIGSRRASRRSVITRSAQVGAAITVAGATGGLSSILASAKAPAVLQDAAPSGKVRLLYYGEAANEEQRFNEFGALYPDVELEVVGIPGGTWADFADSVATRIAGGETFDVLSIATEGQRVFASRGLIDPIDDLLERDAEEMQEFFDDVHPRMLEFTNTLSSPDGQTYFLPGELNTMGIWYNKDVFAAAGVEEPVAGWTWDDFNTTATAITKPGEVYGMHVTGALFASVMPWLLTNGASPLSADWTQATVNTPEAVAAAQQMRQLVADGISPEPGGEFDAFTIFAQGGLGMIGVGRWIYPSLETNGVTDKVGIVPWPEMAGPGSPVGWKSYPIMSSTENREAAWALSKYFASKEAAAFLMYEISARRSIAEDPAFLETMPPGFDTFFKAIDYATPVPGTDNGAVIQHDIESTFDQILIGNLEAEAGLNDLNSKIESNL
jgi:multiple sugar transport system substrate-binding protein